jgi:hypothetical protein
MKEKQAEEIITSLVDEGVMERRGKFVRLSPKFIDAWKSETRVEIREGKDDPYGHAIVIAYMKFRNKPIGAIELVDKAAAIITFIQIDFHGEQNLFKSSSTYPLRSNGETPK